MSGGSIVTKGLVGGGGSSSTSSVILTPGTGRSYFGAYFGMTPNAEIVVDDGPTPVPLPTVFDPNDVQYVDHVADALSRMCQQFRAE